MAGSTHAWEYLTIQRDAGTDLAALGRDGWELVGVAEGSTLYFKRPGLDFRERVTLDQKRRYYALWGKGLDAEGNPVEGAPNERRAGGREAVTR